MGRHQKILVLVIVFGLLMAAINAVAQDSVLVSYQGHLTDGAGNPVPNSTYRITFSLFNGPDLVDAEWTETHPAVQTDNGLFTVILGSVARLEETIFEKIPLYLEIKIGESEIISPRTLLTSVPSAAFAKKVIGDIETGEGELVINDDSGDSVIVLSSGIAAGGARSIGGSIKMFNPQPEPPAVLFEINASTEEGAGLNIYDEIGQVMGFEPMPFNEGYSFKFLDPGDAKNMLSMSGNHITNKAKITFIEPGDDGVTPAREMATDRNGSYFHMNGYDDFHDLSYDGFRVDLDNVNKITSMKLIEPGNDCTPGFELTASGLTNGATFKMIEPGDDGVNPAIEMATDLSGSHLHLNGYDDIYSISYNGFVVDLDNVDKITSMKLIEPGNDNTPGFEFTASGLTNASQFNVLDPADHGRSLIQMNGSSSGGSIFMFNPQPEPPAVLFDLSANISRSSDDIEMSLTDGDSTYQTKLTPGRVKVGHPTYDSYPRSELNVGADSVTFFMQGLSVSTPAPAIAMLSSSDEAKIGIGTLTAGEPLVVGKDLGSWAGNRIVVGDDTPGAYTGLVMGEDHTTRAHLTWNIDDNFLGMGVEIGENHYRNMVVLRDGYVGINTNTPSTDLHVNGDICYTGSIGTCSDLRYKRNVHTLDHALDKISHLRGVSFNWRRDEYPGYKFGDDEQIGLIAQEVKDIVPQIVNETGDGYYNVDYSKLTVLLVEAVKELKNKNEILIKRIEQLEEQVR